MGWNQLREINKENRKKSMEEKLKVDFDICPECAFLLRKNSRGEKLCPMCGWRSR